MFLEHHERYYLYLIISVTIGVLLCLIIITGRIIIQKQQDDAEDSSKDEPKFHKSNTETTITKGFSGDNICEMEGGDIDLTTPMGMSNLPVKNEVNNCDEMARKFLLIDIIGWKQKPMINVSVSFILLSFFLTRWYIHVIVLSCWWIFVSMFLYSFCFFIRNHHLTRTRHHSRPTSVSCQRVHPHY